ncbi:MAG: thioredoxin domain-containing protein [Polyangiaceae bacterium]|nr:thioredoxin domain-containing protein [Polyangiaceae bacterium]
MPPLDPTALLGSIVLGEHRLDRVTYTDPVLTVYEATSVVDGGPYTVALAHDVPVETSAATLEAAVQRVGRQGGEGPGLVPLLHARSVPTEAGPRLGVVRRGRAGSSLLTLLGRGPLTLTQVTQLLGPIAEALGRLHDAGQLHGAVSATTLVHTEQGPAVDLFGLSAVAEVAHGALGTRDVVDPAYRPPELASQAPTTPGPWTDVYGLARVASELLAGRRAAMGGAPASSATGEPAIPSPRALGALVPDRVEAILRRALAPSAAARPEDVREVIALLREAASDPLPAPPPSTSRPSFPEPRLSSPSFAGLPAPNAAPPPVAPIPLDRYGAPLPTPLSAPPRDRGLAWAIGIGGTLVALTLVGGGIFFWMNGPSAPVTSPLTSASAPPYAPSPGSPSPPPTVSRFAPLGASAGAINASDATALVPLFADDASRGEAKAPATLVVFGDLTCPYTARALALLPKLESHYGKNLRIVFKHYPLPEHAHAREAAEAAAAVRAKGGNEAFWKFVEGAIRNPESLDPGRLEELGIKAGVPAGTVSEALRQPPSANTIERDVRLARRLGLRGTPTLFLNGRRLDGQQPYAALLSWVDDEQQRAQKTQRDSPLGDRLYAARVFANITSAEGERRVPD